MESEFKLIVADETTNPANFSAIIKAQQFVKGHGADWSNELTANTSKNEKLSQRELSKYSLL